MNVLVTGGAGFIGSHIVEHLQGNAEVRVLDNLRSGFKHNLAAFQNELIEVSILDRDAVRKVVQGVDVVFRLAALISVPESMSKPIECNEINTLGTLIVLERGGKSGRFKKLVLSTSAAI
jgi:UDP-glucose 4-epimerase